MPIGERTLPARAGNALTKLLPRPRNSEQPPVDEAQRHRLAEAVAFARANSPYFRKLYDGFPETVSDVEILPVTDKPSLMEHFDEWVTDPEITRAEIDEFIADPARAGEAFLGKYLVATTSGSSGRPGIFLASRDEMRTASAVAGGEMNRQLIRRLIRSTAIVRLLRGRRRIASIIPTGGHFAMYSLWKSGSEGTDTKRRAIHAGDPLPEIVDQLNEFQPAGLVGCAGTVYMLANEKEAGRLKVNPGFIQLLGEGLPEDQFKKVESAFGAVNVDTYACCEAPGLSHYCAEGWHHVHTDWVIFEPVDSLHRPTPPGQRSHAVLLTVLYRRTQPILRYELADSVLQRPDPCPCGSRYPAFRVQGRSWDILETADGRPVALAQFLLLALRRRVGGIQLIQLEQDSPSHMQIRLDPQEGTDPEELWTAVLRELPDLFAESGLSHFTFSRSAERPEFSPSGKFRYFQKSF
ncbi:hypothetical protein [Rhodococcus daqingensis]|uniref:Phenylacetate-coenzyme A ligase PaaK, adenylate-forming domain family n=1 Tax=Rhodococcus daqingensis TaxID=2479363 RepID=A0ABW2RVR2_9NOCA